MVINENSRDCIPKVITALKKHEVVIFKCDTIYGLLGVPPHTRERITGIKGRSGDQPLLILIPSPAASVDFSPFPLPVKLRAYWPGPLTMIFPGYRPDSSVALRCPADPFLQRVLKESGLSLYSTSVNRHGEPPLGKIKQIIEEFETEVDLIVDSGDLPGGQPSTIVDLRSSPYRLVRQGQLVLPEELFS